MTAVPDCVIHLSDGVVADDMDYALRIEQRLRAAGLVTAAHDLTQPDGDVPRGRLHVLTGGATSVSSEVGWMRSAVRLAAELVGSARRGERTVIGVCLGAQILAEAIRPGSLCAAPRIEVGLSLVRRLDGSGSEMAVPAFHYERVCNELAGAPGVEVLWTNAHTSIQAFRLYERVFGYQFHPELTTEDLHLLIEHNAGTIVAFGGDVSEAHASVVRHRDALAHDLFDRTVLRPAGL